MCSKRTSTRRTCLSFAFSLSILALNAQAQEKPKGSADQGEEQLTEVVVTGSRIARPDLDRLQPTITVDAGTIDQRGYFDVGQALSELPAFGVQPVSSNNTQSSFGVAQSFVDLYSLGSQRTLVLVNGHRFVSGNTASLNGPASPGQQVDLNTIPTKLIDRIETISVGGAPIYGSDAISGTVNIILKKDFQGIDLDAQAGVSDKGDAWNYRARALAGHNFVDGRLNVTMDAEFTKTDGLTGVSRPVYASDLGFLAPATPGKYTTVLTPVNTVPSVNYGGIPLVDDGFFSPPIFGVPNSALGVTNGAGQLLAWGSSSNLQPYDVGTPTGNPIFNSGGQGLRLSQVSNLLSPTERMNLDTLLHFDITDHVRAFGEGWFSETHSTNLLSQPAYNTALFGGAGTVNGNFVININNPYLSATDRTLIQNALNNYALTQPVTGGHGFLDPNWSANQFYVSRANIDLQGGRSTFTQTLARGVAGLEGDFALWNHNFNWDVSVNYGRVDSLSRVPSYVFQNVQNALNSTRDATGQIVCTSGYVNGATSTASSSCAPLNIFGVGSPSLAALQYITHDAEAETINTQRDMVADLTGDIVKLPWTDGIWKASVGFENRRESAAFAPDDFYTKNLGQAQVTGIEGSYLTNEVYGETLLPIFTPHDDRPFLYRAELEAAVRHVNNSLSGGATTYTYGLKLAPTQDVMFRINKTKSIRAPAVTELFLPAATSFSFANDPCDKNYIGQGNDPATRAKNCAAAGIPAGFVSNVVNATAIGITSGNPNLAPETANSKTFGFVLTPRWIPHLLFNVDYIYIRLTQAISSLALVDVLDACYDSTNYPNEPECKDFTRNAQGQISSYHVGYVNAGLLEFSGINGGVDYTAELPGRFGELRTRVNWFDMQKRNSQIGSAAELGLAGEIAANGGTQASPKKRGVIDIDYRVWNVDWDVQGLFTGAVKFDNLDTPTTKDVEVIHKWWLFNTTLSYHPIENLNLRLIVDNVFNKEPPYPSMAGVQANFAAATSLYFSGIIGRTYQVGADYRF